MLAQTQNSNQTDLAKHDKQLRQTYSWANAYRGKWGQLTPPPGKMDDEKAMIKKRIHAKEQFSEWG